MRRDTPQLARGTEGGDSGGLQVAPEGVPGLFFAVLTGIDDGPMEGIEFRRRVTLEGDADVAVVNRGCKES
jgi:hypothetical protein